MSKVTIPKYTSIAIDIAHSILNETYKIGEKITGRTTLSSKYGVSPETIRKSMGLLRDMNVVDVNEKSGIIIKSKEMAYLFIEKYNTQINIKLLHQKIQELQKQKFILEQQMEQHLNTLLDYTLKYERTITTNTINLSDSVETFRFKLEPSHFVIGKSISETQFFKYTHATIVSIFRNQERILSPGPFFIFESDDILSMVCDETNITRVTNFITEGIIDSSFCKDL